MHNYLITQEQVNEIMKYLFTKKYLCIYNMSI